MGTEFGTLQIRQHIRSVEITSVDCIVFNKCLNVFKWSLFRPKLKSLCLPFTFIILWTFILNTIVWQNWTTNWLKTHWKMT